MPRIEFTRQLTRHVQCPGADVDAATLGEALALVFQENPPLRGYILDDQGEIRKHVAVFIDNQLLRQSDPSKVPVAPDSEIYVMQALSGG